MGYAVKYCDQCKKVFINSSENKCPQCQYRLMITQYDSDEYLKLSEADQAAKLPVILKDAERYGAADSLESGTGIALTVLAIIIMFASVIGGLSGRDIQLELIITGLAVGFVMIGLAKICTLLTRIDARLKKMSQ